MSNSLKVTEIENLWTSADFFQHATQVKLENPERRDLNTYALYGAFHAWKANCTTFHEVATHILKSETMDKEMQNRRYTDLVLDIAGLWLDFAYKQGISSVIAVSISKQYLSRELAKIENWVSKTA